MSSRDAVCLRTRAPGDVASSQSWWTSRFGEASTRDRCAGACGMESFIRVDLILPRFSVGCGDRFCAPGRGAVACLLHWRGSRARRCPPVWNKSNREHTLIGSEPGDTRRAADAAVRSLGWREPHFVDADHISRATVERFLDPCDFFTIDVAAKIGARPNPELVEAFVGRHAELAGEVQLLFGQGVLAIAAVEVRARSGDVSWGGA